MKSLITLITNLVLVKSAFAPLAFHSAGAQHLAPLRGAPCSPSSCSEQRETRCFSALFHNSFKKPDFISSRNLNGGFRCQSSRRMQAISPGKHFNFSLHRECNKKRKSDEEGLFFFIHTYIAVYKCLKRPW